MTVPGFVLWVAVDPDHLMSGIQAFFAGSSVAQGLVISWSGLLWHVHVDPERSGYMPVPFCVRCVCLVLEHMSIRV